MIYRPPRRLAAVCCPKRLLPDRLKNDPKELLISTAAAHDTYSVCVLQPTCVARQEPAVRTRRLYPPPRKSH
ncbi:hypothetical protein E2C01_076051 [Portunus trituberculatus]|uniref:Uncharacterized protein n=1 Tax=Portunus trituberculatus TaxID=210409 RepID=A0A5B7IGU6_PORTR|nr:hypothetical protein [Portunus trituberculatus]